MTKEEFLAIAAARYEALKGLERHGNFYDFEKEFDSLWGRCCMNKGRFQALSEVFRESKGANPDFRGRGTCKTVEI